MKRSLWVAMAVASTVLAAGAVIIAQQSKDDPTLHPGIASIGRILIINHGPKETVPVTIDGSSDLLRVQVAGTTPVQIAGTPNVQSRTMRQMWEYRQLVLPAGQDPTASLNAAGLDGWEATGILSATLDATRIILKRPTDSMTPTVKRHLTAIAICVAFGPAASWLSAQPRPANYPAPAQGDIVLKDFHFRSGETLPEVKMHYRAVGTLQKDAGGVARNAVLVMHGTGGTGAQFVSNNFAGELFGPGQLLDATQYYIVMPDDIGHGQSTKPSDGLHAKFPKYGYLDMVEAEYRLLEGLGVNHLRLVMGTSMGGMHTWLWGEEHPDMTDALMPLASVPTQISGRNRAWRRVVIDAITNDPEWKGGEYTAQPPSLRIAAQMVWLVGDNPLRRYNASPTLAKADQTFDAAVAQWVRSNDANNVLYAYRASEDYDPGPKLEQIKAPLFAVNSADDLVNPPEIGSLEREIKRVPKGRAIMIPLSDKTAGHGTHTLAAVWKQYLEELLKISERAER